MKNIISLLLCALMIFTLCACSKDDEETTLSTKAPTTNENVSDLDVFDNTDVFSEEQGSTDSSVPSVAETQSATTAVAVTNSSKKTAAGVKISWSPISGATSYNIYRSETKDGKKTLIATTKDTSYTDKTAGDKTFYYSIQAVKPVPTTVKPATSGSVNTPTNAPTVAPTASPTVVPTNQPTVAPTTRPTTKPTTGSSSTTLPVSGTVYEKTRAQFRNQIVSNPAIGAQALVKNLLSTAGMSASSFPVGVVPNNTDGLSYYIEPCGSSKAIKIADCKSAYYAYPKNSSSASAPATRLYVFQATDASKAASIAAEIEKTASTSFQMCGGASASGKIVDHYNEYVLLFLK